jgi:hypothetical protein
VVPLKCIQKVEDLSQDKSEALDDEGKKIYMSLVGKIGYVATSLRFDARFAYLVLARRLSGPRQWDLYLAVWVMEYLVGTKWMPLVLGGPTVELETLTDASFGILEERISVKGHLLRTNNLSGAISVNAAAIKNTVTSVWEAEVNAASDGVDTLLYARNLCQELRYPMGSSNRVLIDNESAIHWLKGESISASTKQVEARLFRVRQLIKEGNFSVEYIATDDNVADIFTKSLPIKKFKDLRAKLLGHGLVDNLQIRGIEIERQNGAHWGDHHVAESLG